jgi:hypothetical protein
VFAIWRDPDAPDSIPLVIHCGLFLRAVGIAGRSVRLFNVVELGIDIQRLEQVLTVDVPPKE